MNIRDIDLNLLVVFEAVYSLKNISRAATQLEMSQPALSNAMARLRKQLDDPLFVRAGNGVAPTARADDLIGPVREVLEVLNKSLAPAQHFDPKTSEVTFKLLMADPLEPIILPDLIKPVQSHVHIRYELSPPQTVDIEEALKNGALDLAVFLKPTRDSEINCKALCPVDLVVVARTGHPGIVAGSPENTGKTLVRDFGHATLNLRPNVLANSEKVTLRDRVPRNDICLVNRAGSAVQLVARTDLVCFAPRLFAKTMAPVLGLEYFEPPMPMGDQQFFMIWHKRNDNVEAQMWLRQQVEQSILKALSE